MFPNYGKLDSFQVMDLSSHLRKEYYYSIYYYTCSGLIFLNFNHVHCRNFVKIKRPSAPPTVQVGIWALPLLIPLASLNGPHLNMHNAADGSLPQHNDIRGQSA